MHSPDVNGHNLGSAAHPLNDKDVIELAGVKMEFSNPNRAAGAFRLRSPRGFAGDRSSPIFRVPGPPAGGERVFTRARR